MAKSFFDKDAKATAAKVIAAVEQQTSAEIVLAVRKSSGHYRHADYLAGMIASLTALLLLLFLPLEFTVDSIPLDVIAAFGIAAGLSALLPPLRRALVSKKLMAHNVRTAARAAFVDGGVTRTKGRTGILVFVSLFEQRVAVVADLGVIPEHLGPDYAEAVRAIEGAIARGPDLDGLLDAVLRLGPALSAKLPRQEDDENELSDEMEVES